MAENELGLVLGTRFEVLAKPVMIFDEAFHRNDEIFEGRVLIDGRDDLAPGLARQKAVPVPRQDPLRPVPAIRQRRVARSIVVGDVVVPE